MAESRTFTERAIALLRRWYEFEPYHEQGCPRREDTEDIDHIAEGCDCVLAETQQLIFEYAEAAGDGVGAMRRG